jgi:hypothetical protein
MRPAAARIAGSLGGGRVAFVLVEEKGDRDESVRETVRRCIVLDSFVYGLA